MWAPYKAEHIEELEKVQRRATKKIPGMSNLSYPDSLKSLKLPTLAHRQLRGDLLEMCEILNGQYDTQYNLLNYGRTRLQEQAQEGNKKNYIHSSHT